MPMVSLPLPTNFPPENKSGRLEHTEPDSVISRVLKVGLLYFKY